MTEEAREKAEEEERQNGQDPGHTLDHAHIPRQPHPIPTRREITVSGAVVQVDSTPGVPAIGNLHGVPGGVPIR